MDPEQVALEAARIMDDMKAENIQALDVNDICNFTCYFVMATATSSTQLQALAHRVTRSLRELGERPISGGDDNNPTWVALDYFDVVVHIMTREAREYYDLESLWQDAKQVDWYDPDRGPLSAAKKQK